MFEIKSKRVSKVVSQLLLENPANFEKIEIFEKDEDGVFQKVEDWGYIQSPYYCMATYKGYYHTWMFLPDLEVVYNSLSLVKKELYDVEYGRDTITIGCTTKTPEEWDDISTRELLEIDGRRAVEAYETYWEEVYMKWCSGYRTPYRTAGRIAVEPKKPRKKKGWSGMLPRRTLVRQGILAPIFHTLSFAEQRWAEFFTGVGGYPYFQEKNETAYQNVVSLMKGA